MKMANENKTNPMSKSSKISNYLDEESCSKEEGTNAAVTVEGLRNSLKR